MNGDLVEELRQVVTEANRLARDGGGVREREAFERRKQALLDALERAPAAMVGHAVRD